MAANNYTVASAAQLLGVKQLNRREIDKNQTSNMKAIDRSNNRDASGIKRTPHAKAVRFNNPTDRDDGGEGSGVDPTPSLTANFLNIDASTPGTKPSSRAARKSVEVAEFPIRVKEL